MVLHVGTIVCVVARWHPCLWGCTVVPLLLGLHGGTSFVCWLRPRSWDWLHRAALPHQCKPQTRVCKPQTRGSTISSMATSSGVVLFSGPQRSRRVLRRSAGGSEAVQGNPDEVQAARSARHRTVPCSWCRGADPTPTQPGKIPKLVGELDRLRARVAERERGIEREEVRKVPSQDLVGGDVSLQDHIAFCQNGV